MAKAASAPSRTVLSVPRIGMASSVGVNALSCCAAIRARVARFEQVPFHDGKGKPIIAAPAAEAAGQRTGYGRILSLLEISIRECASPLPSKGELPPLLVCLDVPDRRDYPKDVGPKVLADLATALKVRLSKESRAFLMGPPGVFRALETARQLIRSGSAETCLVAAGDSLINDRALAELEGSRRLKTEFNPDGVIPGEGAACLALEAPKKSRPGLMEIVGIGFGTEASAGKPDEPNLGVGLAQALQSALADADVGLQDVDFRIGGMTGERWSFMEASTAMARVQRVHRESFELWVPAEKLGDVGAALPGCMLVAAAVGFSRKYAPGQSAIVFATSLQSERAACVVRAPGGGDRGL